MSYRYHEQLLTGAHGNHSKCSLEQMVDKPWAGYLLVTPSNSPKLTIIKEPNCAHAMINIKWESTAGDFSSDKSSSVIHET